MKHLLRMTIDVLVIAIGIVAIVYNDKFVGAGLVTAGTSLLAKEQQIAQNEEALLGGQTVAG